MSQVAGEQLGFLSYQVNDFKWEENVLSIIPEEKLSIFQSSLEVLLFINYIIIKFALQVFTKWEKTFKVHFSMKKLNTSEDLPFIKQKIIKLEWQFFKKLL